MSNKIALGLLFVGVFCFSMVFGNMIGHADEAQKWEAEAVQMGYGEWYVEEMDF